MIGSTHHLPFAARADRVLAIGSNGLKVGTPDESLTPDRIRALFGIEVSGCSCCGQALS